MHIDVRQATFTQSLALKVQTCEFYHERIPTAAKRKRIPTCKQQRSARGWRRILFKGSFRVNRPCWLKIDALVSPWVRIPHAADQHVYWLKPPSLNQLLFQKGIRTSTNNNGKKSPNMEALRQVFCSHWTSSNISSEHLICNIHDCFGLTLSCSASLQNPVSIL